MLESEMRQRLAFHLNEKEIKGKGYIEREVKEMNDPRAAIIARCCVCGYQMCEPEVWIPDNMKDNRVYCFSHAPDDAIRSKDTIKAETA